MLPFFQLIPSRAYQLARKIIATFLIITYDEIIDGKKIKRTTSYNYLKCTEVFPLQNLLECIFCFVLFRLFRNVFFFFALIFVYTNYFQPSHFISFKITDRTIKFTYTKNFNKYGLIYSYLGNCGPHILVLFPYFLYCFFNQMQFFLVQIIQ